MKLLDNSIGIACILLLIISNGYLFEEKSTLVKVFEEPISGAQPLNVSFDVDTSLFPKIHKQVFEEKENNIKGKVEQCWYNNHQMTKIYKIPWTNFSSVGDEREQSSSSNDDIYFHDTAYNESIFIVKFSSPNPIFLNNFQYRIESGIIGEHMSGGADFTFGLITNGTRIKSGMGSFKGESIKLHSDNFLRYLHVGLGSYDYTLDNRVKNAISGWTGTCWMNFPWNYTYPAGTWYFVCAGGMFDIEDEFVTQDISVWMNFSNQSHDLTISTYTCGDVYALGYDEFNADVIANRVVMQQYYDDKGFHLDDKGFHVLLNGNMNFHSNHSFLYWIPMFYQYHAGFVNLAWDTPEGMLEYYSSNSLRDVQAINWTNPCFFNCGKPGEYHLYLDYVNWKPFFSEEWSALKMYLIALDIELK